MKATVFRFTNIAILTSLIWLLLTGVMSHILISIGWFTHLHRIGAWALIFLIPWKVFISWRSLKRGVGKRPDRNIVLLVSLLLATLAISIIVLALLWTWQIGPQMVRMRQRLLWWHWILAYVLIVPLVIHVWRRWPKPKQKDFTSRRAALRMMTVGTVGVVGWLVAERLANSRNPDSTPRLITGSRLDSSYTGNAFPVTSEAAPTLDPETWTLSLTGAVHAPLTLTKADLLALPQETYDLPLDCTNGWWTQQVWGGVPLSSLLDQAGLNSNALAVRVTSVTGYSQVFSVKEGREILVCTHVGDELLSHRHGAPARAVVPSRRGWFWVKWLATLSVEDSLDDILKQPFTIR